MEKSISEELEKKKKKRERLIKQNKAHKKLLALNKPVESLSKTQLKLLVLWKKRAGNKAILDTIEAPIKRYNETYQQADLIIPTIRKWLCNSTGNSIHILYIPSTSDPVSKLN